jgi:hypothetical protein
MKNKTILRPLTMKNERPKVIKKEYTESDLIRAYRLGCSDGSGTSEPKDKRYMQGWDRTQAENIQLQKIINSTK